MFIEYFPFILGFITGWIVVAIKIKQRKLKDKDK